MTDTTELLDRASAPRKRTRRSGRKRGRIRTPFETDTSDRECPREGCRGFVKRDEHAFCSYVCGVISRELDKAWRICDHLGATDGLTAELWAEAVALSDGWTRYVELDRRIYRLARSVGITDEQWKLIKEGP